MDDVLKDGVKTFHAVSKAAWRQWLETNHAVEKSVWLIIYKKQSDTPSVYYDEAVDEALCFGWIDSKPNKRDEESFYQYFAKRNPKSNWSQVNKLKVEKLLNEGKMAASGIEMIELAKKNGTWTALDEVSNILVPQDLDLELRSFTNAFENFEAFPKSVKRGILEWILNAKQPETRAKRIKETAILASQNIRANQYTKK